MKRFIPLFFTMAAALLCPALLLCSCSGKWRFTFLSVRMKGNGDGTLTATAQNEFSLGAGTDYSELTVYYSEEYTTDIDNMQIAESQAADITNERGEFALTVKAKRGFFCAVLKYTVDGESAHLQSETINYDENGTRIQTS